MDKEKKRWKKELEYIYRKAVIEQSHNLTDLYIKLERTAQRYMNNREMPEGSEFIIPLGMTTTLKMKFFTPFSEVYEYDQTTNEWDLVLSKQNNAEFEYNNILDVYDNLLKRTEQCLGNKFPENLLESLRESKPGDLLNFEHGNTYVCVTNDSKGFYLKEVKDKDDKLSIKSFKNSKSFRLTSKNNDLQKFYADNRTRTGRLDLGRISIQNTAQEYINNIYSNLKAHATKTIDFGPIRLHVKKAALSNNLKWYDNHGNSVDESTVKTMIGYFNSRGIEREYARDVETPFNFLDDIECEKQVEDFINEQHYGEAYDLLKQQVERNKKSLTITSKGYKLEGNDFIASGYSFVYKNNEVKLYKLSYENNDITSVHRLEKEASKNDFVAFYTNLYNKHRYEIYKANENYINERFQNAPQKAKKPILNDLLEKEVIASDKEDKKVTLTEHEDVKIEYTSEDIDNLLESFDYDANEYDDLDDYDFNITNDDFDLIDD